MGAKRVTGSVFALMLLAGALAGCAEGSQGDGAQVVDGSAVALSQPEASAEPTAEARAAQSLSIQVDDTAMSIELADTDAARELTSKVSQGDIVVNLHPYGGFEQVGELPWTLPPERSASHNRGWGRHALPGKSDSHLPWLELLVLYALGKDRRI